MGSVAESMWKGVSSVVERIVSKLGVLRMGRAMAIVYSFVIHCLHSSVFHVGIEVRVYLAVTLQNNLLGVRLSGCQLGDECRAGAGNSEMRAKPARVPPTQR